MPEKYSIIITNVNIIIVNKTTNTIFIKIKTAINLKNFNFKLINTSSDTKFAN